MSTQLVTVHENANLFEALVISKSNQIRHLPVINDQGRLVGLVTYTDLVTAHYRVIEAQKEIFERAVAEWTEELMEINKKLQEISLEYPLLRIGNRRAMEIDLEHTHATAYRYQGPYAIILLDVDHFKLYNDYYGQHLTPRFIASSLIGTAYATTHREDFERLSFMGNGLFHQLIDESLAQGLRPIG